MQGDAMGRTLGDLEGFWKWISNFFLDFISLAFGFEEL